MNTFLNIPQDECFEASKVIHNNSENKWQASIVLAKNGYYDLAISMMVISTEELVKALIVFANSKGFEFKRSKEMDRFFRDHHIRFIIAFGMFAINDLFTDFILYIQNAKESPNKWRIFLEELKDVDSLVEDKMKPYFIEKTSLYKKELEWFSKLEFMRREGFYCDYKEELRNSTDIDKQKCLDVYKRLINVRKLGKGFIESKEDESEDVKNMLNQALQQWSENNYYEKLDKVLLLFKKSSNPFDVIIQKFTK